MIITTNTGAAKELIDFCRCGHDYGGDRIIVEDNSFIPIIGGVYGCGLDLSGFYKNISQVNISRFKLLPKQSKIIRDFIDGSGIKFLAITVSDPSKPIYWRKISDNSLLEYVSAILNGSINITTSPMVGDRVNAVATLTLNSDNNFKLVTWASIFSEFIDGEHVENWADAIYSWNDYHPMLTTNTHLVLVNNVTEIPFVIERDSLNNFTGEVPFTVISGGTAINVLLKFHGVFGASFIIDSMTIDLDGHLVGSLYKEFSVPTVDWDTPLVMDADFTFLAASGLLEQYNKLVGLMVLTTTDNEPLGDIKLYNGGIVAVSIQAMIGT